MSDQPSKHDLPATDQTDAAFRSQLKRARGGSEDAMGELVRSCQDYLLLVANQELCQPLRGKLAASDAVQETLALAHQRFGQFHGLTRDELVGWLRAILKNQILMANRRFSAEKRDVRRECVLAEEQAPLCDPQKTPQTHLIAEEEASRLRQALRQLSDDHRQVIVLRNWEQLPFSAVAQHVGRSEDAAKKLWARAMKKLKQALDHETVRKES